MPGIDNNTVLMLHLSNDFSDSSEYAKSVENSGVEIAPEQGSFTGRCAKFNGKSILKILTDELLHLKDLDFTIDFRIKRSSGGGVLAYDVNSAGWSSVLLFDNLIYSSSAGSAWDVFSAVPALESFPLETWNHFALVRKGQSFTIYKDGKSVWSGTSASALFAGGLICVGQQSELAQDGFIGYIEELRVSNVARWTSDFEPPTEPYSPENVIEVTLPRENGRTTFCRQFTYNPKDEYNSRRDGAIVWGMPTSIPEEFGDGSDGDLIIRSGEVVELDVPEPHISVIEKRYSSILIESGGILRCKNHNAGLVLRCSGDCTIHGIVDQSGKSPKTNPNNTYQYPPELVCGKGGKGGGRVAAMPGRPYGGGWGSGGPGGGGISGGTTDKITVAISDSELFKSGKNGGGGPGTPYTNGTTFPGRPGASTPGGNGEDGWYRASSGGAGNYGGGVILLYVNGNLILSGSILCTGLRGGNGGKAGTNIRNGRSADGAGGGGGGTFYCLYNGGIENTATINVDGGAGGLAGKKPSNGNAGVNGEPGENGTITIKKYGA